MTCTCQYGTLTPKWYITVKTCPEHHETYRPDLAPGWWNVQTNDLTENDRFHRKDH